MHRPPSRSMPPRSEPLTGWFAGLVAGLFLLGLGTFVGWVAWQAIQTLGWGIALGVAFVLIIGVGTFIQASDEQHRQRMHALITERPGESICTFARSFDVRRTDTWIIRAVWDEVQASLLMGQTVVPLRPSDRLLDLAGIDGEDLEDAIVAIADRCGRSLDGPAIDPPSRIETVGDVVEFLMWCPRARAA